MRQNIITILLGIATLFLISACKTGNKSTSDQHSSVKALLNNDLGSEFSGDSAFHHVANQVKFGPRVPGSEAHKNCQEYIKSTLKRYGADSIITQTADLTAFDGTTLPMVNILGRFNSSSSDRIILVAHYDSRPWADNDPLLANRSTPILGANDGASGVGVLLELARLFSNNRPQISVDLLFVDDEDYGCSDGWELHNESWALGSQYFANNLPYSSISKPRYGIVLDMVGGIDARFHREYFSDKYVPVLVDKVWSVAEQNGLSDVFINEVGGSIIDDHLPLCQVGIPTIDIVECNNISTGSFPATWHTVNDNLDNISSSTLNSVGKVVAMTLYNEAPVESVNKNMNVE